MAALKPELTVITGATGHIGGMLIRELLKQGRKIRCFVMKDDTFISTLKGLDVEFVYGDVLNYDSLVAAFTGATVVYHLAAVISIAGDPDGTVMKINTVGPRNVARAAAQCGVRKLVHTTSIHSWNQFPIDEPLDEKNEKCTPNGTRHFYPYEISKAMGEQAVKEECEKSGLDWSGIAPTGVMGPGDYRPSLLASVMILDWSKGLNRIQIGPPAGVDIVDVRDVVRALMAAEVKGKRGEVYLTPGHFYPVTEIARLCHQVEAFKKVYFIPMWVCKLAAKIISPFIKSFKMKFTLTNEIINNVYMNQKISYAKANRDLDYTPMYTLADTIRDTCDFFRADGRLGDVRCSTKGHKHAGCGGASAVPRRTCAAEEQSANSSSDHVELPLLAESSV